MSLGLKRNVIELISHDTEWEHIASQTIKCLWGIFCSVAKDIQHIGSTSIKDIQAKLIIDIAVAIDAFSNFEPLIPALEDNGFSYRDWFLVDRDTVLNVYREIESGCYVTTHHVHVVKINSKDWNDHILFRDYLNSFPSKAKEYEAIKIKLASEYPYDEEQKKYNCGKNGFIVQILSEAENWKNQQYIE